jgi:hypothetical protein
VGVADGLLVNTIAGVLETVGGTDVTVGLGVGWLAQPASKNIPNKMKLENSSFDFPAFMASTSSGSGWMDVKIIAPLPCAGAFAFNEKGDPMRPPLLITAYWLLKTAYCLLLTGFYPA